MSRDRVDTADTVTRRRSAPSRAATPAVPIGNRQLARLVTGRGSAIPSGARVHPQVNALMAPRRMVQRQPPTREEMLAELQAELSAGLWDEVALRLNGFNKADIQRLAAGLSVQQMRETRAAVERVLNGWPMQQTILDALDTGAKAKGAALRPSSRTIWAAYSRVSYAVWSGEPQRNRVWEFLGGNVGQSFENENTCAARLSYGLNYGGAPIPPGKWANHNSPRTVYNGKAGDGKRYIVSAWGMQEHLTSRWGRPDATLATNADAAAFEATLRSDQVAVFAGGHHVGLIKPGYRDAYVFSDPAVMPVVAWKLP